MFPFSEITMGHFLPHKYNHQFPHPTKSPAPSHGEFIQLGHDMAAGPALLIQGGTQLTHLHYKVKCKPRCKLSFSLGMRGEIMCVWLFSYELCDSPWQKAVERDELLLPDGPDVLLEGLLQLVQLIAQLVRSRWVVPEHTSYVWYSCNGIWFCQPELCATTCYEIWT